MGRAVEETRQKTRDKSKQQIEKNLEILGNPFDEMDWETKCKHALFLYNEKIQVLYTAIHCNLIFIVFQQYFCSKFSSEEAKTVAGGPSKGEGRAFLYTLCVKLGWYKKNAQKFG